MRKSILSIIKDSVEKTVKTNNELSLYTQKVDILSDEVLPKSISAYNDTRFNIMLNQLEDKQISSYLSEAMECAKHGYYRASIVMGWCATIDRLQKIVQHIGFDKFNDASKAVSKTNKFKWWNKSMSIQNLSDLQRVSDNDLLIVFEGGLQYFDGNEGDRLKSLFDYRNQSAHPGNAPIDEPHLIAFFHDITTIVINNPKLENLI